MSTKRTKNKVYQSLIDQPTIAGVSRATFGMELLLCMLFFNYFKASIPTVILIAVLFFVVHPFLRAAYKEDPLLINFMVFNAIKRRSYFPANSSIGYDGEPNSSSIPKPN